MPRRRRPAAIRLPRPPATPAARGARALALVAVLALGTAGRAGASDDADMAFIDTQVAAHAGQSGAYVLDSGEEALLARAWLADHARQSIEVQYFIWSTDNIGILAAEALLRAADRGVKVRVIVDDLLIDAPDKSLLALALHPNIDIRIYNPRTSVGVPLQTRLLNAATDFRGVNQRMHDKTMIVDGKIGITGGRNMAAEYYDYHHDYNFRDRDVLLLGPAAQAMHESFGRFWASPLAERVETLYDGLGLFQRNVSVNDAEVTAVYRDLHAYARDPSNFAPEVRAAIADTPSAFARLSRQMTWGKVEVLSDTPGKNSGHDGLGGGGLTSAALARLVAGARERVTIESPYLVLSPEALDLFRGLRARGVRVRICTNSLASTDNLQAFSGYRSQRDKLLRLGLELYEYRPDPANRRALIPRIPGVHRAPPVFALHAKTLVVDGQVAFIGTYNFDPRSQNLNTETGAVIHDAALARGVEQAIEADMEPGNSWNAATDNPDQYVKLGKRSKARFYQLLPLRPLL